jgi:DNA-binding GntR family transcriptional regulator
MSLQSDYAYEEIKNMIFRMELLPGDRIPEMQIAAKLGISRTPIHDALRRLQAEDLVIIRSNRGAEVRFFTDDEVKDIGAIRLAQDILSIKLAAYYGCASDFDKLRAIADACEAAAASGNKYERIRLDMDFHLYITEIGRNERLLQQQRSLYQQVHLIQISKYTDVHHSLMQISHHLPLIEAIQRGNISEANKLAALHLKDFFRIEPYLIKQYLA